MCVSSVRPRIVGDFSRGRGVLERVIVGCLSCSRLSGVKRVTDDLSADAVILFVWSQSSRFGRYVCILLVASSVVVAWEVIVRSSAYDSACVFSNGSGCGISCMKRLKSVGDRMAPCGTPL